MSTRQGSVPVDLDSRLEKKNIHTQDLISDNLDDNLVNDPLHQIQDVKKATTIIEEYLSDTRYRDSALMRTLGDVQSRADSLEDLINDFRMEIKVSFKEGNVGGGTGRLQSELKGLRDLMQFHADERHQIEELKDHLLRSHERLDGYGANPDLYKQLISANTELETEVANAHSTVNLVIGLFGLVVLIVGFFLWLKMRQYEKKHFL
jgi:Mg2+ and Co2+ transporter CorA